MGLMKKPLDAILDWLWDRLTYLVMNQGEPASRAASSGHSGAH